MITNLTKSLGTDFYLLDELLTDEERQIRDKVRDFCDREVIPVMNEYWDKAEFPFEMIPKLGELGIAGEVIEGYGCPGMSRVASGLIMSELARGDSSIKTAFSAHSSLVMGTIHVLGSEEQRQRWLPPMAKMEKIGAFALTEPNHGSDVVALESSAERDNGEWVINGQKKWIGHATFADVIVFWARDVADDKVKGFLVEKGAEGLSSSLITGKTGKRAIWQAELKLDNVRIPAENKLEHANSFKDTSKILTSGRHGVAWEAIGPAVGSYEAALTYAKEREIFGRPEASYQLIQNKLANMLAEITNMQLMCFRLAKLLEQDKMTPGMASLAKMSVAKKGKQVCSDARELLGGNGILLEYQVAKHAADAETIYIYEGTDIVQSLIVGREITGSNAFT